MSARAEEVRQQAEEISKNKKKMAAQVKLLEDSSRRTRQNAASVIAEAARIDPSRVAEHSDKLIDALNRPEAQTRWEALDALSSIVSVDARLCDKALQGAENALFDEDSGPLRLSAMRFLCVYGATTENRSEKVWSLIDEGIQCYHGDVEYNEMLNVLIDFSAGKLSVEVKKQFTERMSFDATNGKGSLGRKSSQIVANLKKKK